MKLALLLLTAASLGLAACEKKAAPPPPPKPDVDVVVLQARPVTLRTELPGRVNAFHIALIRPQVSGVILKRLFTEGDDVKAGQQLYQIDPRPYEAVLASAQAAAAKARAVVTSSKLLVERYGPLARMQAVSKQDLDNARATLLQNQADVATAEAQIRTAQINLAYTRVYSPIAGHSGRSSVTDGALVTADQADALVTVTQLDPIYVDVTQPSETLRRLKRELAAGTLARAGDNAAVAMLQFDDSTPYDHPGKLLFSEVTVDQATGSVTLRALFPNPEGLLLPGTFVRETLAEGVRQDGILVPQRGVTHNAHGDPTAMVVDKDGKAALRTITTDRAIGTDWLVTKGLAAGDRVIVSGLQKAKPGTEVHAQQVTIKDDQPQPVSPPPAQGR